MPFFSSSKGKDKSKDSRDALENKNTKETLAAKNTKESIATLKLKYDAHPDGMRRAVSMKNVTDALHLTHLVAKSRLPSNKSFKALT
ncbi:hypothetical protein SARC_16759, partial [Sphaeroforma arctica JP610]